jgi:glycerophosphoryl diester phosphodiesterase
VPVLLAEVNNLKYARNHTMVPIIQLTDDLFAPVPDQSYANYSSLLADMSGIASYAQGIGPYKATLLSNYNSSSGDIAEGSASDSGIVDRAHSAGLQVRRSREV